MNPSLLIRLRPTTPWRIGPPSGAREECDCIFHSDALYSALCGAFRHLGLLEEWLAATAREEGEPAVRFSSCFPWQRTHLFAPPPAGMWPPPGAEGARVRWKGARFVPLSLIGDILRGDEPRDEAWSVDAQSGCLLPADAKSATGPFRFLRRSSAAVDRPTGGVIDAHSTVCLQFAPASGLWCAAEFSNQSTYAVWAPKVEAAFRLLADDGFGGLRSLGFGRCRTPDFQPGLIRDMLLPDVPQPANPHYWLISLFSPHASDRIEWGRGDYKLTVRGGRVAGPAGAGLRKLSSRMVTEGSVLAAPHPPRGAVRDVAPGGCPHPVFRAGYALSLTIPWRLHP
jgi:CRISPR type III-A-associated RAMP protein Csm4